MYEFPNYRPTTVFSAEGETGGVDAPTVDVADVATRATSFMDLNDVVRKTQAAAYAEILGEHPFAEGGVLEGVSLEDARDWAAKRKATPDPVKQRIRDAYSNLKPSYQWLKAFIATGIAIEFPDAVTDVPHRLAAAEAATPAPAPTEEKVEEKVEEQAKEQVEAEEQAEEK
jgi:hypothetical protein